eukprot:IDg14202t1
MAPDATDTSALVPALGASTSVNVWTSDSAASVMREDQEAAVDTNLNTQRTTPKKEERLSMRIRNAKLLKQEELRTHAVRSMAESAKRKSDALEER